MFIPIFLAVIALAFTPGQGDEAIVRQNRPLSSASFDEIMIDGPFDVLLTQSSGKPSTVDIETTADAQSLIVVEILEGHILSIHSRSVLIVHKNVNAYIQFSVPLRRYTVKGTGNTVTTDSGISNGGSEKFVLENHGTANVAMQLNVGDFEFYMTGTGNSRFWGQAREQALIDSRGVGDVNAVNLQTKKVKVRAAGVSTVRVAATDDAEIEVTGVSSVYYRLPAGKTPSKATSTGLGKIIPIA